MRFDVGGALGPPPGAPEGSTTPWTYDQIKQSITEQLRTAGHASMPRTLHPPDAVIWRRAARAAARDLGRTVRTSVTDDLVRAVLADPSPGLSSGPAVLPATPTGPHLAGSGDRTSAPTRRLGRWVMPLGLLTLAVTVLAVLRGTDGLLVLSGAACLVLAAATGRAGSREPAERLLWRNLAWAAAAAGAGLVLAGGTALVGLDPAIGVHAGSTAAFLLMYRALIGWNRFKTAEGDPGDWLNGLSATGVLVSVGLLVLDLTDLPMDLWTPWQTYAWLLQVGLGVVVWGTTLTLIPLGGLGGDYRWRFVALVVGLLAVGVVASAAWGFETATRMNALGWTVAAVTLAWCARLTARTPRPTTVTPHATIIGAFVVFLSGATLLALDALLQPRDHVVGTVVAASATAAAALRLRRVVDELDSLARSRDEAVTDDLTGLVNRRGLVRALRTATAGAGPRSLPVLVLVDLDRFKEVNDTFGHAVGDDVLRVVAQRMQTLVPSGCVLARLGGDEFAVVVPAPWREHVDNLTTALLDAVHAPLEMRGRPVALGASIGVARTVDAGHDSVDDGEELLRRADAAMYEAKREGGGVRVFDRAADRAARETALLVEDLGRVLRETPSDPSHPVVVHYQPQVAVGTGEVCGLEALVRWHHPVHGLLSPDRFVDLAEQHGLMGLLTVHVLEQAVAEAASWERRGHPVRVSVNLSASCLETPAIVENVTRLLAGSGLSPHLLALEITETVLMKRPGTSPVVLDELVRCGVSLSVDDFGTGYSSLAYLADLPVAELKIDRSFVSRMRTEPRTLAVVAGTIDLAHRLDLRVVAEGVEDDATLQALRELGCDVSQGYLHAPARSSAELAGWLTAHEIVMAARP